MAYLGLVRHGISEYNAKGLWTGWHDPDLTDQGILEAKKAGESLKDIRFDFAFTSILKRSAHTLEEILNVLNQKYIPVKKDPALNERNYGIYTAKNKWEIKKLVGDEEFRKIRRVWDYPIPEGESLKQVFERLIPFYESEILPLLKENNNCLVVSSGNPLRALIKYLEDIPDEKIADFEIQTGEVYLYQLDKNGKVISKQIRASNPNKV